MTELSSSGTVLRPYFLPRYILLRFFFNSSISPSN
nr:MAG TPA: hypothetical protein [Microviridae sp.]